MVHFSNLRPQVGLYHRQVLLCAAFHSLEPMAKTTKPVRILSSGFVKLKVKAITSKTEKKKACEEYLKRMKAQRLEQKRTRSTVEDTDDAIRFLTGEIDHLSS